MSRSEALEIKYNGVFNDYLRVMEEKLREEVNRALFSKRVTPHEGLALAHTSLHLREDIEHSMEDMLSAVTNRSVSFDTLGKNLTYGGYLCQLQRSIEEKRTGSGNNKHDEIYKQAQSGLHKLRLPPDPIA